MFKCPLVRETPLEERVYAQDFSSDTTQYINWELGLQYPAPGSRIDFRIAAHWFNDNGTSWDELWQPVDTYVEGDGTVSYHGVGNGCDYPEKCWDVGSYRVDIYFEGKKIASEQFEVHTPSELPTPSPTDAPTSEAVNMATALAPLRNTSVQVYYLSEITGEKAVYDNHPAFAFVLASYELIPGQSYCMQLDQDRTVILEGVTYSLFAGWNLVTWNTGEVSYYGEGIAGDEACLDALSIP